MAAAATTAAAKSFFMAVSQLARLVPEQTEEVIARKALRRHAPGPSRLCFRPCRQQGLWSLPNYCSLFVPNVIEAAVMLTGLAIRDFVLVRALDFDPGEGFTALTGETGAGKSILMSALGFALGGSAGGAKAGQGLIRPGGDAASVTASFEVGPEHPVRAFLRARGVDEPPGEPLVFRRAVRRGGAARAFLNDR